MSPHRMRPLAAVSSVVESHWSRKWPILCFHDLSLVATPVQNRLSLRLSYQVATGC